MNGFLLDTNVPSELILSRADRRVEEWVYSQDEQSLHLSAVSIGEIRRGIVILSAGKRRANLEHWLDHILVPRLRGRILPVTHSVADRWGILDGECQMRGTPLNTADGMIAATALEHDLAVVTRNVKHFIRTGVRIVNPWEPG